MAGLENLQVRLELVSVQQLDLYLLERMGLRCVREVAVEVVFINCLSVSLWLGIGRI